MLKLKYFGHLIQTAVSLEKSLMLGKIEGWRRRGHQRMRWLDGITNAMDKNLANFGRWWGTWRSGMLQSMGLQRVRHNWVTKQQQQSPYRHSDHLSHLEQKGITLSHSQETGCSQIPAVQQNSTKVASENSGPSHTLRYYVSISRVVARMCIFNKHVWSWPHFEKQCSSSLAYYTVGNQAQRGERIFRKPHNKWQQLEFQNLALEFSILSTTSYFCWNVRTWM